MNNRTDTGQVRIVPLSFSLLLIAMVFASPVSCRQLPDPVFPASVENAADWKEKTARRDGTSVQTTPPVGGRFDLMGNGALMLEKKASDRPFHETTSFRESGTWTSTWRTLDGRDTPRGIRLTYWVYGQKQQMEQGWTKFAGNPLISKQGWKHVTEQTLQLPAPGRNPNDQALVRGAGRWEGKWVLFFNIGSWAREGWGMAVADSLAPLKDGRNPFTIPDPYPIVTRKRMRNASTYKRHAPNDLIYVESDRTWYSPDETDGGPSHLWTAGEDLLDWQIGGPIRGIKGHDPGMVYDGNRYHLFNEDGERIVHCQTDDPLKKWNCTGHVMNVGDHTGDADVSFYNNRWHVFFDDHPHGHYKIGYARTTPEKFPRGWLITHHIYGPHRPEQQQVWDNDTMRGNRFGTGDADVALEGKTLYLTHERPIGLGYRPLRVLDGSEQAVAVRVQADSDGDGTPDESTGWHPVKPGTTKVDVPNDFRHRASGRVRLQIRMNTENPEESPMIRDISPVVR